MRRLSASLCWTIVMGALVSYPAPASAAEGDAASPKPPAAARSKAKAKVRPATKVKATPAALTPVPLTFDLRQVPFSRFGSYYAFSQITPALTPLLEGLPDGEGLYFRNLHGFARDRTLRIDVLRLRKPVPFQTQASPGVLRLAADGGTAEICFATPSVIRIRAQGVGVRLSMTRPGTYDYALPAAGGRWELNLFSHATRYALVPLVGTLSVDAPFKDVHAERILADFQPQPDTGTLEAAIEPYETHWTPHDLAKPSFAACVKEAELEFARFAARLPAVAQPYEEARRLAAYVLWSSGVAPAGPLKRPALLMSKNWMTRVWSWDHGFNAMALSSGDPALAWDQFLLPFEQQNAGGALPDSLDDATLVWNFTKPPVHGWMMRWMMRHSQGSQAVGPKQLAACYEPLGRWTRWWLAQRDYDGDGVPQYNHGNDSGWDNATTYRAGLPLEAPDLSAFLVVQMDVLAEVARALGKKAEARAWSVKADTLAEKLYAHSWKVNRFIAPTSGEHKIADGDSLALFLPLVLGERLTDDMRRTLVAGLKEGGRFATRNGLATESLKSPLYEADGYWRGPIWAPSTLILVDSLETMGERDLAREVARRFCDMVAASGMAENFDAVSGKGLRDPAYTWTASVFLILASVYAQP